MNNAPIPLRTYIVVAAKGAGYGLIGGLLVTMGLLIMQSAMASNKLGDALYTIECGPWTVLAISKQFTPMGATSIHITLGADWWLYALACLVFGSLVMIGWQRFFAVPVHGQQKQV